MADQQGTGKHPHKSAAEPTEHHEAPSTKGASQSGSTSHAASEAKGSSSQSAASSESHSDGQGTGKHPHKKASDPKEHHEGAKVGK